MTNIYGVLNSARSSIMAQQAGIEVTGQNLANVNTAGYSRQLIKLEASSPVMSGGGGAIGTGVKIAGIQRAADGFITGQLNNAASNQSFYNTTNRAASLVETVFNEADNRGLSNSVNKFFNAFHDLSLNAKGITERSAVIATASLMTDNMRRLSYDLKRTQTNMEDQIKQEVNQVNLLTTEITDLSKRIHSVEGNNIQANDLRDLRDEKVKALANILDITSFEDASNKELIITTTSGKNLVLGQTSFKLETSFNGNNKGFVDININDGHGTLKNITQDVKSGSLQGFFYMRDTVIPDYLGRLDKFAAGIIREVNRIHSSGYGLDKKSGVDFFSPLGITARNNVNNAGNATISGAVGQQGFVSADDYQVQVTGAGTFVLNNLTTGLASGTFTFASGSAVDLGNGMRITLSGSAQTGDLFTLSSSEDAALRMAVNATVSNDPNKVAAGKTLFSGDGTNATSLADLQNSLVFSGNTLLAGSGTVTFQEYYSSLVGDAGIESMKAAQGMDHQNAIQQQLFNQRERIAGVSIDEEMVNMIKFQQVYNASAKLLATVKEMLTSLQQAM